MSCPRFSLIFSLLLLLAAGASRLQAQEEGTAPAEPVEPEGQVIQIAGEDPPSDAAIAERLRGIYASLNLSGEVQVSVNAGVVTLSGALLTQADQQEALQLARQVEGVVEVQNDLENIYDARTRLEYVYEQIATRMQALLAFLPVLGVALLVLTGFWLMGNLLIRWNWLFNRLTPNAFLADLFKQLTRAVLVVVGLLLGLQILDAIALLGAILGAAGLLGLALGFALRDTIENYIATILLSLRQPFDPNDFVAINQFEGKVVRMTPGATILMTFDGNHIRIPNAQIYKGILVNFSSNPQRRFGFEVDIPPDVDLTRARALAVHAVRETHGVITKPEPQCFIQSVGASANVLEVHGWTDQRRFDMLKVRSASIEGLKSAFASAGIAMPEPTYRLRLEPEDRREATRTRAPASAHVVVPGGGAEQADYLEEVEEVQNVRRDNTLDQKINREAARTKGQDLLRPERGKKRA